MLARRGAERSGVNSTLHTSRRGRDVVLGPAWPGPARTLRFPLPSRRWRRVAAVERYRVPAPAARPGPACAPRRVREGPCRRSPRGSEGTGRYLDEKELLAGGQGATIAS
ncbi:Voltage-dependent calcium channel subunit alpha-2/delta-2 [Frankliniella fusca]|uniref:Voltage-dependent calcium channel subunit alpha-2/delta-2 n=1 Tax=Frankliniella fusca TaxID=407009 RepID=A0AAE1L706_9NEOP|nr:Voltage-dependent calcium channel subunit alpha-2/delta-2 [Frankliniella fusca]